MENYGSCNNTGYDRNNVT